MVRTWAIDSSGWNARTSATRPPRPPPPPAARARRRGRRERQAARRGAATPVAPRLGELVRLGAVDASLVREEQDPVVRGRHEEGLDEVVLLEVRAAPAAGGA